MASPTQSASPTPPTTELGVSEAQLAEFAEFMDVDVSKEGFLLPIVSEALRAPLPEGWAECEDAATGEFYYRNRRTEQTMWEHPLEQHSAWELTPSQYLLTGSDVQGVRPCEMAGM